MDLIYIGNDFYEKSGTIMSPIYEVTSGGYERFDWGFVESALENGEEIHIRQANRIQMKIFEEKLAQIISRSREG